MNRRWLFLGVIWLWGASCVWGLERQMETLDRGLVGIVEAPGRVFLSWRLLGTEPLSTGFYLYRRSGAQEPVRLNEKPLTGGTWFLDEKADLSVANSYCVRAVIDGKEQPPSRPFELKAAAPVQPYLSIPLQTLPGHRPSDAAVGDLDGDGRYEIVIKQEMRPRDNSHRGMTGQTKLEAYDLDGRFLWRIDLGKNIREGAHYTPFIVYDLDGDGRAEVAVRTADGTVDGCGKVIGDPNADYRNSDGRILEGPEYLTIFDGRTGAQLAVADYVPPRGNAADWGDTTGNRADRFLACVAYLDGKRPSLIMCRGYYTRMVLAAWNWRDGKLPLVWTFDSEQGPESNRAFRGQGNHNLAVGDVDGDGKDEILYGACAIDDDGKGLYSTGLGHGDAMHLADIDPDHPGLEIFAIHENPRHPYGANLREAATGKVLWGLQSDDVVRGVAMDIDPRHRGYECWAFGRGLWGLYNCKGIKIAERAPRSCNMGIWWDGDLLRELLNGVIISKWDYLNETETVLLDGWEYECIRVNGSKSTPSFYGDILGDWREEVIWPTRDGSRLRIFVSAIPTDYRFPTLMHDPIYRLSAAWQNVGYNQPTQTGFYLGEGMTLPTSPETKTPNP
ncbi:MAG TPA: rhamnogalacturonan lyase [Anaerohalosphaeraceae bacterium]|nr:rhamnogalacturonan lyase [Anaerohalosphaeraceae bacterium]HQG04730.1 rhamnogalacturonan lyase [Anaerohalosphaeraceae bacterium]HQI06440.1 rhamnogalacturonan lyase [Anaerohalosphaeraceae bacterium]HQJ66825.1 rhamnogalacturonan lyase [Anaerohalosphaeraceae bacterium]